MTKLKLIAQLHTHKSKICAIASESDYEFIGFVIMEHNTEFCFPASSTENLMRFCSLSSYDNI